MNSRVQKLSRAYRATLRRYLDRPHEDLLQQAYELGRKAIAGELGVLDVARIHQQALDWCLTPGLSTERRTRTFKAAETFFMEMLSPFEVTHRGFRQANLGLQQVNEALEHRNSQLATEVSERKRTEKALRDSQDHYRQLLQEARQMQENLRHLSTQILHAQERERKRISRELHDEVGQALTAINTSLGMLQTNGSVDPTLLKKKIADSKNLVGQTMVTVHRFARELRPAALDELGLLPTLRSYLKAFAERTGLQVHFHGSAEAGNLDDEQKTVVFRVLQESLTNVARHARASQVTVTLSKLKTQVDMQVKDNGQGVDLASQLNGKAKKRLGLLGMQERVRLVNGHFTIQSAPGCGTTVSVEIPFKAGRPIRPSNVSDFPRTQQNSSTTHEHSPGAESQPISDLKKSAKPSLRSSRLCRLTGRPENLRKPL